MAEVIINRKWAEMIKHMCLLNDDCPGCEFENFCDDILDDVAEDAPCNWDLDIMQDEAEGGVFAEYDE